MLFMFVKLAWVAINVNYRVMWYMIINCTGFIYVNFIECFSVSSNVSLDLGLVCDKNFNNIMDFFRGVIEVVSEHGLRITEIFDMLTCKIYWGLVNYSDRWKFSLMHFRNLGWWGYLVLLFLLFLIN